MVRSTLRPVLAATSAIVLSACAYATPYEMSFSKPTGITATDRSSAKICADAFSDPGASDKVMDCLKARGYDWDVRGFAIRRQSGLAGHLSIPAAAIAVGLTAAGNTTDIVPIMGLAGGSYLAHTGAYARPDQAQVYELAADSYRCLVAGAADWKADGKASLVAAFDSLEQATKIVTDLNKESDSQLNKELNEQLKDPASKKLEDARIVYSRIEGENGLILLRQSNAVEAAARTAIGDRLPSAQAVASSVGFGTKINMRDDIGKPEKPNEEQIKLAAGGDKTAQKEAITESDKKYNTKLDAIEKFNEAQKHFYIVLEAHQLNPRKISTDCRFNPSSTPQLTAPAEIVLDATNKAGFVLKGGVPPYGYLPLPDKVKVTITPLTANAAHIAIDLNGSSGDGPWEVTIIDASQAGDTRTISVKKAPKPE